MSKIPAPDDRIGERYRVVRLIGEGGMGAVFEAENLVTQKRVALKWLHPSIANRPEAAQRLVREAQAASRIRHPNVVDVYDVITNDDTIFLVLELLEGEPLYEVLERGGMKVPQLIGLLIQAMRGVAAAHHHGVIHRDVHPGNIFLERPTERGEIVAKVLDFGISKLADEPTLPLTQSGTTMGTPLYMSYEQLCATRDLDVRADVYSFGVILYRALTGRHPFAADSLTELAVQFATTKPPSVKALRPEIPGALDRLVMACVARDRELRPSSMEALIAELEPFASEDGFRALLSGRGRQIPLVVGRASTRLHAEGASLIPPTHMEARTPRSARVANVSTSEAPRRGAWPISAFIAVAVLLLAGASGLLLLERSKGASAEAAPPVLPAMPESSVAAPAAMQPSEPRAPRGSEPPATSAPIPNGMVPPNPSTPAPGVGVATPPAKPARVWLPRSRVPAKAPPSPSGPEPYYRAGRPPSEHDFK